MATETNWVEPDSPFVGFPQQIVGAILEENPAAGVVCALDEGARDYFLFWKLSGKETE
jgi:hypothetical protein